MHDMNGNQLRIVHLSDPQLGFTDSRNRERLAAKLGIPNQDIHRYYTAIDKRYLEQAFAKIKKLDPLPDAVLVTGDLVDSPDSLVQWEDYISITQSLQLPVYEAMGNHDGFTVKGLEHYRKTLKKVDFYSFMIKGVLFLVLNSNYLKNVDEIPEETRLHKMFVEKELAVNQETRYKIMLMHHPLYFEDPDEEEVYFSLPTAQRKWVLDLVDNYHVVAVLSGHYHRNHIVKYKGAALITTGPTSEAMGFDNNGSRAERGFRTIDLNLETGEINHSYITLGLK